MSEAKQIGKRFEFSIAALNDVLTETKSVKKKLTPFLAHFQKHNMQQIYQTLNYLYNCMTTPKGKLTYKFNSLFALKVLMDSSNYVLVNWIEVLFLPQIIQIAKYLLRNKDEGKNFFVELGYSSYDDAGIQKMGFNYVLLALQLIQVGAKVKPYRLLQTSPVEDKSDFTLALQQLCKLGFKPPQTLSFYKQQALDTQISRFEQQLISLEDQFIDKYVEFSNMKLEEYLVQMHGDESEKNGVNIVRILEGGDLFLTKDAVDICKAEIKRPQSLVTYKNALHVLHRLFITADYDAFSSLHNDNTLQQSLFGVLKCSQSDKSLRRGAKFLPQFQNLQQSKKIYSIFLNNLKKWSLLSNSIVKEDKNLLKKVVEYFEENLGIEFPGMMENYENERKLFQIMRERNVNRNEQLAEDGEGKPIQFQLVLKRLKQSTLKFASTSQIKPKAQQNKLQKANISSMKSMNTPAPPSERSQSTSFERKLKQIQDVLNRLHKQPQNYEKNKAILLNYNSTFEEQLLMVPEEVFDSLSQRAFGLKQDIDRAIRLGSSKIKQQKKAQQKSQSKQFPLEQASKQSKGVLQQQKASQYKKTSSGQLMIDTPVKKFEIDQPSDRKHKLDDLVYDMPINLPVVNTRVDEKQQNSLQVMKKAFYAEQHQKEQSFSVTEVENKHKIGYEFLNDSNNNKVKQYYYNPIQLGYNNEVKKEEQSSQSRVSNRSFRKTEEIAQMRKRIQQVSSVKSVSKVEHFSPDSSIINDNDNFQKSDFKKKNYDIHEEDLNIPLEENQINENYSVKKPKEFNSLSANRESKTKVPLEQINNKNITISPERFSQFQYSVPKKQPTKPSEQPIMPFSNISSPLSLSSRTKQNAFNDQIHNNQGYQYEQEELLDEDQIYPPNINPLEESFHDVDEIEMKIKSKTGLGVPVHGELSFKNCFETDKYILQRQQEKQSKLYWLQSDSNNLVKNILLKKEKRKSSTINIPQLLNEKNMKHQSEIKAVEEQKNIKIKELEGKIKNLQKESQFMKTQLTQHIEEIKSLKAYSEYDKESVGQRGYLQDVENIAAQKLISPMKFGFSASRGFKLDSSNVKENVYLDPKGKLINSKDYKKYFEKFRTEKQKKKVLKNKDLLYKDKDIQIGFMSKKQGERLLITLFVTPEKDLQALDWTITENNGLQIESQPNGFISSIRARKQQKIFFTIQVNQIHFILPEVQFAYKILSQKQSTKITLPCSFHKFFFIKEGDADFEQMFKMDDRIIRGEEVPYSKRLLKSFDNLREYFQCMTVLNKGLPNGQGEICYGGFAMYKDVKFPVRVCIKPNQFLYIQGVNDQWRNQNNEVSSIIQYYISLLTHLLMKEMD